MCMSDAKCLRDLTAPDIAKLLPTVLDGSRLPENQYGGRQTGSSYISGTGRDINEIPMATPTFSTSPYSMDLVSTLPDIGRLPENQYGGRQTGSSCILRTERDINEVLTAIPTFSTRPYSMELISISSDVGRLPEINMAAIKPEEVVSLEGERYQRNSNGHTHIFDHVLFTFFEVVTRPQAMLGVTSFNISFISLPVP